MKIINSTIDFKSTSLGFLFAALLFVSFAFTHVENGTQDYNPGRYQAVASDCGVYVIDTETGDFIERSITKWIKYDFNAVPFSTKQ